MKSISATQILILIFGLITCALIIEKSSSASAAMPGQGQPFFPLTALK